jgi:hypothetical protein
MQLYRLRPNKNPYYFWAVMSIYMQVTFSWSWGLDWHTIHFKIILP